MVSPVQVPAGVSVSPIATLAAESDPPEVRTYTQVGERTWRQHRMPALAGVGVGIVGGAVAGLTLIARNPAIAGGRLGLIAGAAAVGVGLAGFGAAWGIRALVERNQPDLPSRHAVPVLPAPAEVSTPSDAVKPGQQLGYVRADWTTQEEVCTGTGQDRHCRWETRHHSASTRLPVDVQAGRLDGYATKAAALADHPGRDGMAVVRDNDRYYLFALDGGLGGHWGDVSVFRVDEPNVVAIATPGGTVWEPRSDGSNSFRRTERVIPRINPGQRHLGDQLGEYALDRALNVSGPRVGVRLSPSAGYTDIAEALGDAAVRPGNQVVMDHDGVLHVHDLNGRTPRDYHRVTGLKTTEDAARAVAMELDGRFWQPAGPYWVTREQGISG